MARSSSLAGTSTYPPYCWVRDIRTYRRSVAKNRSVLVDDPAFMGTGTTVSYLGRSQRSDLSRSRQSSVWCQDGPWASPCSMATRPILTVAWTLCSTRVRRDCQRPTIWPQESTMADHRILAAGSSTSVAAARICCPRNCHRSRRSAVRRAQSAALEVIGLMEARTAQRSLGIKVTAKSHRRSCKRSTVWIENAPMDDTFTMGTRTDSRSAQVCSRTPAPTG